MEEREGKKYYTLYEVSFKTGVHFQTLYGRIRRTKKEPTLINGIMYFDDADIEELIKPLKIGRPRNAPKESKQVKPD